MPKLQYTEHYSLTEPYTSVIKDLAKDLFKNTDISYFIYIRATAEGASNLLVSDGGLANDWFKQGNRITVGFYDEYKSEQTFSYLWSEKLPRELVQMSREKHNIYNGISIVRRYRDYCELFGFADSNSSMDTSARFLSCHSDLENYGNYFLKAGKDVINNAMKNPLPEEHTLKVDKNIFIANNKEHIKIRGLFGDTHLSPVEYFTLQLILKGKTYKEIARILAVSPKAIEKYLTKIKYKIGYNVRDIMFVCEYDGKVHLSLCNSKLRPKKWV